MPVNSTDPLEPEPPTELLNEMVPAFADTAKVLVLDVETAPPTVIFEPVPEPLTPRLSAVVSSVVFDDSVMALFRVIAPAVRMVPLKYKVVGTETVNEPKTVKVSPAALLIVSVPALLNVKL